MEHTLARPGFIFYEPDSIFVDSIVTIDAFHLNLSLVKIPSALEMA